MGTTKTEHFTEKQSKIAIIAKAMGHPARVAIIDLLLKVNACIGNDILEKIPLAQPTISQHLKVLKDANLSAGEYAKAVEKVARIKGVKVEKNNFSFILIGVGIVLSKILATLLG